MHAAVCTSDCGAGAAGTRLARGWHAAGTRLARVARGWHSAGTRLARVARGWYRTGAGNALALLCRSSVEQPECLLDIPSAPPLYTPHHPGALFAHLALLYLLQQSPPQGLVHYCVALWINGSQAARWGNRGSAGRAVVGRNTGRSRAQLQHRTTTPPLRRAQQQRRASPLPMPPRPPHRTRLTFAAGLPTAPM